MVKFGDRILKIRNKGKDVEELQLRLAGFLGTVWDGNFGPKTKKQVLMFQKEFMEMTSPTGIVDQDTFKALDQFAEQFPIDFDLLLCKSKAEGVEGVCACSGQGFGQNRFRKIYTKASAPREITWSRTGKNTMRERRHQYEYPGIHKAILHTFRAFLFFAPKAGFSPIRITSGYRCHINNVERGRGSTNHMGKAIDFTFAPVEGRLMRDICNDARKLLQDKSLCQVRWENPNQKALEPGHPRRGQEFIAPTWVHLDVRNYEQDKYLQDRFFVRNVEELDSKEL